MKRYLDPGFWAWHFRRVFIPQIELFERAIRERLLPTFDDLEREADEVAEEAYRRLGELAGDESSDMADVAEAAQEEGLAHYEGLQNVRQALLNLAAAALYHLVEQQWLLFHRRQVLLPSEEDDRALFRDSVRHKLLKEAGVDVEALPSWPQLEQLRLLANAVKHADGPSADALRQVRPDLLTNPLFRGTGDLLEFPSKDVRLPLAGEGVFVTPADLEAFGRVAVAFWTELAETIENAAA